MQLHCLAELKLERESIDQIPSLSSSLRRFFILIFGGEKEWTQPVVVWMERTILYG